MKSLPTLLAIIVSALSLDGQAASTFNPDAQPTGWLARPELTDTDLRSGTETVFQLNYTKGPWNGDILARAIGANAIIATTGPWDPDTAASKLDALNYNTGRKIGTLNGNSKVAFRWASLSAAQQATIGDATDGPKILDYIRGDRTNEEPNGLSWRGRVRVLGDIQHSTLVYFEHDASTKRLYVGANDGMLHAFDAATGAEVFAYVPSMVIPKLKNLIAKTYVHAYFVDGGITVARVVDGDAVKVILVGSLGAGGKGIYALDITTPTAASDTDAAGKILWEVAATGSFADLGYTYGTPRIARLNSGTAVAIFGNGYVNGGNGHAVLYIVNLFTGALVKAIDTGSGTSASPNGLSTPTLVDINGDGRVDLAYAGDLDGHLWRFDLSSASSADFAVSDGAGGTGAFFTTSPLQAITSAPAVSVHPEGGRMVTFATGRMLTGEDAADTAVHYAYGVWDGAPAANNTLLIQTLSDHTYGTEPVRTITRNIPNWTTGDPLHKGWKVALPAGERVTGELPFVRNGRFYFVSTDPTALYDPPPHGDTWLYELVATTGGSPAGPIFDLNVDGAFDAQDLAGGCTVSSGVTCVPVAKAMGAGVFSQPVYVLGDGFNTTLFTYHPDTAVTTGSVDDPDDPGVSGGHFDFDIYYWGTSAVTTTTTPTADKQVKTICAKTAEVEAEYNEVSPTFCTAPTFSAGYVFMSNMGNAGTCCDKCDYDAKKKKYKNADVKFNRDITCNKVTTVTESTVGQYANKKHVHEYDDKYDVTGVNMLNPSLVDFKLDKAITDATTPFKVLVMNQYLSPAAKLSVGGATYESVKTYKNLASATNATTLLAGLPTYTRANIGTLIYNLPLDAFKSKDWWGDGGVARAGLIPTQTGCVNKVNKDGSMVNSGTAGLVGPNGERFDGSLTIQLIRDTTPADALEFNHNGTGNLSDSERAKYGWRVKQAEFSKYVLAEYTSFWHHPNKACYGQGAWIQDPPEDPISDAKPATRAAGSADPTDGVFGAGLAVTGPPVQSIQGNTVTTTTTYSDGSTYVKTEVTNADGSVTVTQTFRDGTTVTMTISGGMASPGSEIRPGEKEEAGSGAAGRQSWRELVN